MIILLLNPSLRITTILFSEIMAASDNKADGKMRMYRVEEGTINIQLEIHVDVPVQSGVV